MLASFVEAAAATRVTASLTNVRQREMTTDRLLMLGQLCDVESRRVLLPRNQWQWRTRSDVSDHAHSSVASGLTTIRRKFVSPISAFAQERVPIKRKLHLMFTAIAIVGLGIAWP